VGVIQRKQGRERGWCENLTGRRGRIASRGVAKSAMEGKRRKKSGEKWCVVLGFLASSGSKADGREDLPLDCFGSIGSI